MKPEKDTHAVAQVSVILGEAPTRYTDNTVVWSNEKFYVEYAHYNNTILEENHLRRQIIVGPELDPVIIEQLFSIEL